MDLSSSTVAVTGATGFIGRYLVRALLGRGSSVVGVVRDPDKVPGLKGAGVTLRRADLADVASLGRAFEGCDAVISNAGLVSIGAKSRAALMAANARGTRNVMAAMKQVGVRRAVMTSSASVYRRRRGRTYAEQDPLWQPDDRVPRPLYYALSKAAAEREAWRWADEHQIELSVARPSGVYGAFDRTGFTSWMMRFTRSPLLTVFPTHLRVPNVYAGDLAEAMVRMLERPVAQGRAYNVAGDPDVTFWQMLEAYRRAGGRVPPLVLPVPVPLRFSYCCERARRELGFSNRAPEEAFRELLALQRDGS